MLCYTHATLKNNDKTIRINLTRITSYEPSKKGGSILWTGEISGGDIESITFAEIEVKEAPEYFDEAIRYFNDREAQDEIITVSADTNFRG